MADETVATFGYKGAEAKVFHLKKGEALPEGWSDAPPPVVSAEVAPSPPAPVEPETEGKPRKRKGEAGQ